MWNYHHYYRDDNIMPLMEKKLDTFFDGKGDARGLQERND